MNNSLSNMLRDADPLRDEAPRDAEARRRLRDAVLSAPRHARPPNTVWVRRLLASTATVLAVAATVRFASHSASDAVRAMHFEVRLAAAQDPIVDNDDIRTARVVPGGTPTTFGVELTFTPDGGKKMYRATASHIGERLEILVDDEVVLSPIIRSATSQTAMLTGAYTRDQANRIVVGLLKGQLEVRSEK